MPTDTASYVGKVTYLILLLFSELCLPQSPELTLKWNFCWGACVKPKRNSVRLRTWLTHLGQSLLCAHMYTHVRAQTRWTVTAILKFFLISLESLKIHSNRAMEAKDSCSEKDIFQDNLARCLCANNPIFFSRVFGQLTPPSASDVTIWHFLWGKSVLSMVPGHTGRPRNKWAVLIFITFIIAFCPAFIFHLRISRSF